MNTSSHTFRRAQRGGFGMGIVAGLLIGLALALGVALYITKAPVPFVNKVPARTADQDNAEIERNRTWDPNAGLGGKVAGKPGAAGPAAPASAPVSTTGFPPPVPGQPAVVVPTPPAVAGAASAPGTKPAAVSSRDAAAILSGSTAPPVQAGPAAATQVDPFIYFVQAGAYTRNEEAEQQRAKLALLGQQAKITEREQAGRTMYRVRVGPFPRREDADNLQIKLQEQAIESQIVRVEKP